MTDSAMSLITRNHHRLLRIASFATILAVVILLIYVLLTIGSVLQFISNQEPSPYFEPMTPLQIFRWVIDIIRTFLYGLTYFMVLRAVSVGLRQVVETDLNYRLQAQGVKHE